MVVSNRLTAGGQAIGVKLRWSFNAPEVEKLIGKRKRSVLNHQGALVRKIARRSIRRKGRARAAPKSERGRTRWIQEIRKPPHSPPGHPPFTHTGFLREDIVYAFDPRHESVLVGPWRSPWLNALHEFGGSVGMTEYEGGGVSFLLRSTQRAPRHTKRVKSFTARYPARPFMGPALEKAQPDLTRMWAA